MRCDACYPSNNDPLDWAPALLTHREYELGPTTGHNGRDAGVIPGQQRRLPKTSGTVQCSTVQGSQAGQPLRAAVWL